jgi:hypothetical protein
MTIYKGFTLLEDGYYIRDPRPDAESHDLLRIPLYHGVPLDSASPVPVQPYFCFLGKAYYGGRGLFIELSTLESRRCDIDVRKRDYEILRAVSDQWLFNVWDSGGALADRPSSFFVDASMYTVFEEWDKEQYPRWMKLYIGIPSARLNLPYDVYNRFIQPAANQIELFFTPFPGSPIFDLEKLKDVFQVRP